MLKSYTIRKALILICFFCLSKPAFANNKYTLVHQDNIFEYHLKKVKWEGREGVRWRLKNKTDFLLHIGSITVEYQCNKGTKRVKHYFPQDIESGKTGRPSYPDWPCPESGDILEYSVKGVSFYQNGQDYEYNQIECLEGDPKQFIVKNIDDQKSKIIIRDGLTITTTRFKNIPESIVKLICEGN